MSIRWLIMIHQYHQGTIANWLQDRHHQPKLLRRVHRKFRISRRRSLKKILKRQKDAYCSIDFRNVFKNLMKCNLGTSIYYFPGSIFRLWPKKWIGKFHFIVLLKDPSWPARRDLSNELFRIFLRLLLVPEPETPPEMLLDGPGCRSLKTDDWFTICSKKNEQSQNPTTARVCQKQNEKYISPNRNRFAQNVRSPQDLAREAQNRDSVCGPGVARSCPD